MKQTEEERNAKTDLLVEDGLSESLVPRVEECIGFGLVLGFEALLFSCPSVLTIEHPVGPPIQTESLFHTLPFLSGNGA